MESDKEYYELLKTKRNKYAEKLQAIDDKIKSSKWQQNLNAEEESETIQCLADEMWEGALTATKYEPNIWPWSKANENSKERFIGATATSKKCKTKVNDIGISKEEMLVYAQAISKIEISEPKCDDGSKTQTFKYLFLSDYIDEKGETKEKEYIVKAIRITSCGDGYDIYMEVTVDGESCRSSPLSWWPKSTILAALWLLDCYEI